MKREPVVFAVLGVVFGFVLGYMVASWDAPRPATVVTSAVSSPPVTGRTPSGGPGAALPGGITGATPAPLDPNELKALESLAARDPQSVSARVELGNLLMDHARYDEAARWYREALKLSPDQPDVIVDLGACLVNGGKAAEGLVEFDKALKKDPNHKKALFNKGIALMETGQPREAVAVWEALLKRYPDDPQLQDLRQQIERVRGQARGAS
jgi:cytochrome c-type biogenesis protein CcmH/NrfG